MFALVWRKGETKLELSSRLNPGRKIVNLCNSGTLHAWINLMRNNYPCWFKILIGSTLVKLAYNPSVSVSALMTLIDFTLSNARRFYSSMGNPSDTEGLSSHLNHSETKIGEFLCNQYTTSVSATPEIFLKTYCPLWQNKS